MTLSRSLSRLLLSSSATSKWTIQRPASLLQSSSLSTKTLNPNPSSYGRNPKSSEKEKLPRPSEIPFQPKVANSVHLVGTVGSSVQLRTLSNAIYAICILVQEKMKNLSYLSVPVIFQGDLAQIAACHLKENDLVYVTGQLTGDIPALAGKDAETSSQIQVLVNTLSFVQKTFQENENIVLYGQDEVTSNSSGGMKEPDSKESLWSDLVEHPQQWCDNRLRKLNGSVKPKYPDFKQKSTQKVLWLHSAPAWILEKLDSLKFSDSNSITKDGNAAFIKKLEKGGMKEPDSKESLWSDLVEHPQQWYDNRLGKLNGSVNPKYPDFKHKSTPELLRLDTAPAWILEKLDGLKFSDSKIITKRENPASIKKLEKENLWKKYVENPNRWWDNRSNKLKPNYPDFKHKDTGEALWLSSSTPTWVLPKLPPLKSK